MEDVADTVNSCRIQITNLLWRSQRDYEEEHFARQVEPLLHGRKGYCGAFTYACSASS